MKGNIACLHPTHTPKKKKKKENTETRIPKRYFHSKVDGVLDHNTFRAWKSWKRSPDKELSDQYNLYLKSGVGEEVTSMAYINIIMSFCCLRGWGMH